MQKLSIQMHPNAIFHKYEQLVTFIPAMHSQLTAVIIYLITDITFELFQHRLTIRPAGQQMGL